MAGSNRRRSLTGGDPRYEPIPPGATTRASAHDLRPGEKPDPVPSGDQAGSPGDEHADAILADPEYGYGEPLEPSPGRTPPDNDLLDNGGPPYAGPSGGAVGGTPAEKRSTGGTIDHGLAPSAGEVHVDSTLGHEPARTKKPSPPHPGD